MGAVLRVLTSHLLPPCCLFALDPVSAEEWGQDECAKKIFPPALGRGVKLSCQRCPGVKEKRDC